MGGWFLKLVVLGDYGVEKTKIISQFVGDESDRQTTRDTTFHVREIDVDGQKALLRIQDTSGQPQSRRLLTKYVTDVHGAVLIYDVTSCKSFESIAGFLQLLQRNAHPRIAIIVIGHTPDCDKVREVSFEEGQSFAEGEHLLFIETYAKDPTNISEAFWLLTVEVIRRIEDGDFA
jgi:small GTP-binding protein